MTKTFCDRCGAEIKQENGWLRRKALYSVLRLVPPMPKFDWKSEDKYLCPDCSESYIHWFLNPEPPKEETQHDYEAASDMRDRCERYEPTYNSDDGSM